MADLPERLDLGEAEIVERAKEAMKGRAGNKAPTTVKLTSGGVVVGAAAFGPAGGVVGATVGSGIGYLLDKRHFDSEEDPDVIEADVTDEI